MPAPDFPIDFRGVESEQLRTYIRRRLQFLGSRILGPLERASVELSPGTPPVCDLTLAIDGRGLRRATATGADGRTAFDLAVETLLADLGRERKRGD